MESMIMLYVNESAKALEFYKKAFDAKVCGDIHWQSEDEVPKHTVIAHAELDVFGQTFAISDLDFGNGEIDEKGSHIPITGNIMQICLRSLSKDVVHKIYDVLKEGAIIHHPPEKKFFSECCFELIDKYGVNWCIFE